MIIILWRLRYFFLWSFVLLLCWLRVLGCNDVLRSAKYVISDALLVMMMKMILRDQACCGARFVQSLEIIIITFFFVPLFAVEVSYESFVSGCTP